MKNTKNDIVYCGVNREKIKNAKPKLNDEVLRLQNKFIFERYRVMKRKNSGQPMPWTTDPILRDYRFTNVFREDDRESKYLIENISKHPTMSLENKVYNTILFRSYNKWETLKRIGAPFDWDNLDVDSVYETIKNESAKDPKYVWFTNAFNTGGLKRAAGSETIVTKLKEGDPALDVDYDDLPLYLMVKSDKYYADTFSATKIEGEKYVQDNPEYRLIVRDDQNIPLRIVKLIARLKKQNLYEQILTTADQKECYSVLNSVKGFGAFLSYQIFVDLTYIPGFKFSENEFTISGPGCSLGLSYLFEDMDGMNDEEALFWWRDNIVRVWKDNGLEHDVESLLDDRAPHDRHINIMSSENIFCETSKYVRAARGTGRPRNKYKPTEEKSTLSVLLD